MRFSRAIVSTARAGQPALANGRIRPKVTACGPTGIGKIVKKPTRFPNAAESVARGVRFLLLIALASLSGRALADDAIPPKVNLTTPGGVNVGDGGFSLHVTDFSIGPLSLDRFTQPLGALLNDDPFLGQGMTNNFDIYVSPNYVRFVHWPDNPPVLISPEYHPVVHIGATASGVYEQAYPFGSSATIYTLNRDAWAGTLSWSGGAYVYSDKSGTVYTFTPSVPAGGTDSTLSQRIASISFPDGRVQTFSYDTNKHLRLVNDSSGYAILFDYNTDGNVAAACGFNLSHDYVTASSTCTGATLKVSYGYTGGLLTSFTDVLGKVTAYSRESLSGNGGVTCIKPPGYSTCRIQNLIDGNGVTYQQNAADGSTWYVSTDSSVNPNDPEYVPLNCQSMNTWTDPNGKTTTFHLTKSTPCDMTDANGHQTTYQWTGGLIEEPWYPQTATNEGTLLTSVTFPEGDMYLAEYNGGFNEVSKQTWKAKPGSGLADRVVQYAYISECAPQGCVKLATKTDAKGNVTNYDYYSWGGTKSEMQPAPSSGAARPLKLYDYVQKYPYIKNSGGTLVAGPNQLWVANSETDCQTLAGSSTATCDTAAPITVTTYEYGANGTADNLLLRGKAITTNTPSGAPTLRTCYGYDAQGNKIWVTSPRAGLTSCP